MDQEDLRNGGSLESKMLSPNSDSEIRREFSHHSPGVARINNGSFGCCPASVLSAQRAWQLRFLQQPDDFYFNLLPQGILNSRSVIKDLIHADHLDQVLLVDNATTAAAIVLQQIGHAFSNGVFCKNDSVLMLHCAYQSVKNSIQAYVTRAGGSVVQVHLPFPVHSKEQIISAFRRGLEKGKANGSRIRLAIIDHITSMPSVVLPVCEMVKICREEGVEQVFVDAAHAIGSVPLNVKEVGADFYVSNLHKWFFCPPSVAFLYCRRPGLFSDALLQVVSQEHGNGLLNLDQASTGTRDCSSYLVVPAAMDFVNRFEGGIDGIMKRNHDEVVKMGEMLLDSWGTNLGAPPEMCASMIMVGLPSRLRIDNEDDAPWLRLHLREKYGVEVPIHFEAIRDGEIEPRDKDGFITGYVRISHQVYNSIEDYKKLRDAICKLVKDRTTCKMLTLK